MSEIVEISSKKEGEAFEFVNELYSHVRAIPEKRLQDQLFGSSTSICANLAEFAACVTNNHRRHKLVISLGEVNETQFWLDFCRTNGILTEECYSIAIQRLVHIRILLVRLMKTIPVNEERVY
ncbi:four helix bundle protein [Candidatus Woesearchaeota archaeon]|nr:four helix bundle protein [Candidatus Woesearchaeota archaeon]